jgi:hypothetical protein
LIVLSLKNIISLDIDHRIAEQDHFADIDSRITEQDHFSDIDLLITEHDHSH